MRKFSSAHRRRGKTAYSEARPYAGFCSVAPHHPTSAPLKRPNRLTPERAVQFLGCGYCLLDFPSMIVAQFVPSCEPSNLIVNKVGETIFSM